MVASSSSEMDTISMYTKAPKREDDPEEITYVDLNREEEMQIKRDDLELQNNNVNQDDVRQTETQTQICLWATIIM